MFRWIINCLRNVIAVSLLDLINGNYMSLIRIPLEQLNLYFNIKRHLNIAL